MDDVNDIVDFEPEFELGHLIIPKTDFLPLPVDMLENPVNSFATFSKMQEYSDNNPGSFHSDIAAKTIHWFNPEKKAWLQKDNYGRWQGWRSIDVSKTNIDEWTPWKKEFDDSDAPIYRWFCDAQTNAAFNEVDRHVFAGQGNEAAFFYESEEWDNYAYRGLGKPEVEGSVSRKELLIYSAAAAICLNNMGLKKGDSIAIILPSGKQQVIWEQAAKRLGIIYCPLHNGLSAAVIAGRIVETNAKLLITSTNFTENGKQTNYVESSLQESLKNYISSPKAISIVDRIITKNCNSDLVSKVNMRVIDRLRSENAISPDMVMKIIDEVISIYGAAIEPSLMVKIKLDLIMAFAKTPPLINKILIDDAAGSAIKIDDIETHSGIGLLEKALKKICNNSNVNSTEELLRISSHELVAAIHDICPCVPVEANFPLCIIYSSGSTSKARPIVHSHAGFVIGSILCLKINFDAVPARDVIFTTFPLDNIVSQSAVISGALAARISPVISTGNLCHPKHSRFCSVIYRRKVTVLLTSSTFLKPLVGNPSIQNDIDRYDLSSLRIGCLCCENSSTRILEFAREYLTPFFINSYWATELGSIAFGGFYGNPDMRLKAAGGILPMPWVKTEIRIPEVNPHNGIYRYRKAANREWGEIVITKPFPYHMFTLWGNADNVNDDNWKGNIVRLKKEYYRRFINSEGIHEKTLYIGDFAIDTENGYMFHDRYNDTINISGNIYTTEDIEKAVSRQKYLDNNLPIDDILVITVNDGGIRKPLIFLITTEPQKASFTTKQRFLQTVEDELGQNALPLAVIPVSDIPRVSSGKISRMVLEKIADTIISEKDNLTLLDLDSFEIINNDAIYQVTDAIKQWQQEETVAVINRSEHYKKYNYLSIESFTFDHKHNCKIVTLKIDNRPVNALSSAVLKELIKVFGTLEKDSTIKAVIIASDSSDFFIAGADIREIYKTLNDRASAREFASVGHALFAKIEKFRVPVIAAIKGMALGGGCELAMSCHYRIGDTSTIMGQPEINLFIPPGFGGTQRLPRIITEKSSSLESGLKESIIALISGKQMESSELLTIGLLDEIVNNHEDVISRAHSIIIEKLLVKDKSFFPMTERHNNIKEWEKSMPVPLSDIITDSRISKCMQHSIDCGRGKVANAIIKLVQIGFEQGYSTGLAAEAEAFAAATVDNENGGKKGLALFFKNQSPPLPVLQDFQANTDEIIRKHKNKELIKIGTPFFPGKSRLPEWQIAYGLHLNIKNGEPQHGDPINAVKELIIPVNKPTPDEILVYILASSLEDTGIISGVPDSVFSKHKMNYHILGKGGIGIVVAAGSVVQKKKTIKTGDIVVYSANLSSCHKEKIVNEGFGRKISSQQTGAHQQFVLCSQDSCIKLSGKHDILRSSASLLCGALSYQNLFSSLAVQPQKSIFIEESIHNNGLMTARLAQHFQMKVIGQVDSKNNIQVFEDLGAKAISTEDYSVSEIYSVIPEEKSKWNRWLQNGNILTEKVRDINNGQLFDFAISSKGGKYFSRTFQMLASGGKLLLNAAKENSCMSFIGKPGRLSIEDIFNETAAEPSTTVLLYYGTDTASLIDEEGLEIIERVRKFGGQLIIITQTFMQKNFLSGCGFSKKLLHGITAVEELEKDNNINWLKYGVKDLPDAVIDADNYRRTLDSFLRKTCKPLKNTLSKITGIKNFHADIVIERAFQDTLAISTILAKPNNGVIIYIGEMTGKRYSFYAEPLINKQLKVKMATAEIIGTNRFCYDDMEKMQRMIDSGTISTPECHMFSWSECKKAYQMQQDRKHIGNTADTGLSLINHAFPETIIKNITQLQCYWQENNIDYD